MKHNCSRIPTTSNGGCNQDIFCPACLELQSIHKPSIKTQTRESIGQSLSSNSQSLRRKSGPLLPVSRARRHLNTNQKQVHCRSLTKYMSVPSNYQRAQHSYSTDPSNRFSLINLVKSQTLLNADGTLVPAVKSPRTVACQNNQNRHQRSILAPELTVPKFTPLMKRVGIPYASTILPTPLAEHPSVPQPYLRNRRTAVSSEPVTMLSIKNWEPPVFPKSPDEEMCISQVISSKLNILFGHLSKENETMVVAAMFKKYVPQGTILIMQGDEGDNFYIVNEGRFDIFVTRLDGVTSKVMEATKGTSFGELALMYNAPRAATCIAAEDSIVWALDRLSFRMLLVTTENTRKKRYESLLEHIEIFSKQQGVRIHEKKSSCVVFYDAKKKRDFKAIDRHSSRIIFPEGLTKYERSQLSDILIAQEFDADECVIKQGDRGDKFYIVESVRRYKSCIE